MSSLAKNGTTNIFIKINAGNPKLKAVNANDVSLASSVENSFLFKKRKLIISSDNNKIPTKAGIEK